MPSPDHTPHFEALDSDVNYKPPLVVILGPTAVGKTALSIELAESLNGEIISADSRLFYRGMDIGTAKPTLFDRESVTHHLIDIAYPDEIWTLATFKSEAQKAIEEITSRGRLPFLVGGTGQYIRAVIEDWSIPEVRPDFVLRSVLEDWSKDIGAQGLHDRLRAVDPKAADQIDSRNMRRTIRALEVILSTGRQFSDQRKQGVSPFRTLLIGLTRPRDELYQRVDSRISTMVEKGFVEEVQGLLDKGCSADLPSFSAIGYREMVAYIQGKMSLADAIEQIKKKTRIFVRRQANWFKPDDPDINWFKVDQDVSVKIQSEIKKWMYGGTENV